MDEARQDEVLSNARGSFSKRNSALKDARISNEPIENPEREELFNVHKRGQRSCSMNEATFFMMGVAGLSLWAAIVAVLDIIAARERKRLLLPRQDG
jgi:hypothetical protein